MSRDHRRHKIKIGRWGSKQASTGFGYGTDFELA
jgi:hypothetical protein